MIKLIIGQNAIGKSVYIKKQAKQALGRTDKVITNFWDKRYINRLEYNDKKLEILSELFDADSIKVYSNRMTINCEFSISDEFYNILNILCKDGKELYLDEPEHGLKHHEVGHLVAFIYKILDFYDNIEIVTHSELFLTIIEADIITVENNNRTFIPKKIERGIAYETID